MLLVLRRVRGTVYDFFAYLSSGSVIAAVFDYLYGYQWLQAASRRLRGAVPGREGEDS